MAADIVDDAPRLTGTGSAKVLLAMISYAQNGEDVVLNRFFQGRTTGLYIDVGANHPTYHSVTAHFYKLGWRGINIDPNPYRYDLLRKERPDDINLCIALGHEPRIGTLQLFERTGLSTLLPDLAEQWAERGYVPRPTPTFISTLAAVCRDYVRQPVDFLKVDVEGSELDVIRGADWAIRPRVLLVEGVDPLDGTPTHAQWDALLTARGYIFTLFDGLNRFYCHEAEDAEAINRLTVPANVRDGFIPLSLHLTAGKLAAAQQSQPFPEYETWAAWQALQGPGRQMRKLLYPDTCATHRPMLHSARAALQAKYEALTRIGRERAASGARTDGDWGVYDRREDHGMFLSQVSFLRGLPSGARILDVGCGNNAPFRVKEIRPDCYYVGLDVGDYNQDRPMAADKYIIVEPEAFTYRIATLGQFDGVISTHNLAHCNDRSGTLLAMVSAVKPGGDIYMLFPSELSASLPSRRGGLNYFDDGTHQGRPPAFQDVLDAMRGFEFVIAQPEHRPLADMLLGLYNEPESIQSGWIKPGTWALHGFEAIIWGTKSRS